MLLQFLNALLSPITLVLLVCGAGWVFKYWWLVGFSLGLLLTSSLPPVADAALDAWQSEFVGLGSVYQGTSNAADAVVVLGGAMAYSQASRGVGPEWGDAVDRFFVGVDLYKSGAAPLLLISGGSIELPPKQLSEGEVIARRATEMGVRSSAVVVLPRALDTQSEAQMVRKFFGIRKTKILLVTSAFHMRRAKFLFEREGFEVRVAAADVKIPLVRRFPRDWLPRASAIAVFELLLREVAALAYYELKDSLES